MSKKDQPDDSDTEKYRATLEKGQANLEKYKKMVLMTQNVFRVNCTGDIFCSSKGLEMFSMCNEYLCVCLCPGHPLGL